MSPPDVCTYNILELPSATVTVRHLRENDVRCLEWHGGENLRSFYEELWRNHQSGEVLVVVAEYNNFPIGQAVIHWPGKPTQPGVPDIQSLRVHPIFRGQRIGSSLIATCEALVADAGYARIGLSVAVDNHRAQKLYERQGYALDGPAYCDVWFYTDARGHSIRVEEDVRDMVKNLAPTSGS